MRMTNAEGGVRNGMTAERAWLARPEAKFERARETVHGVIARMRALLANDAPGVCESLAPDEVEMLMLQLKLGAGHLGAAAVALREVEQERRVLAAWREREELRWEPVRSAECGMGNAECGVRNADHSEFPIPNSELSAGGVL